MKKLLTLTAIATLLVAGTAMAADRGERSFIQPNATFATGAPTTTNNDDSCDIGGAPAATLLLPFFSVDVTNANGITTLFTLTNTSQNPQIAHITVWTDWSYPVLDFNIYLTGYDVQGINIRDILVSALPDIPPTGSSTTLSPRGTFSATTNPNFDSTALTTCATLPGNIPDQLQADVLSALTNGDYGTCDQDVGGDNPTAQGYITVDTADTCSQLLPTDPAFYLNDILWDNTLVGDWQQINIGGRFAGGEQMVHIRAIPEGGNRAPGAVIPGTGIAFPPPVGVDITNFPYTFYDRYTNSGGLNPEIDRRQPLPGVFAARFIEGGALDFDADLTVWREGNTVGATTGAGTASCGVPYTEGGTDVLWANNGQIPVVTYVRFDEAENPSISAEVCQISPCPGIVGFTTEEASQEDVGDSDFFPPAGGTSASGWLYLNLNGGCIPAVGSPFGSPCSDRVGAMNNSSQAWVTTNMSAEGSSFSTSFDAAWLQNGCTPNPGAATVAGETGNTGVIGPANPGFCPPGTTGANLCTNVTPAVP